MSVSIGVSAVIACPAIIFIICLVTEDAGKLDSVEKISEVVTEKQESLQDMTEYICTANRKKIMWAGIAMLLFMAVVVCCLYFGEKQIQYVTKRQVCRNVAKHEDELLDIIKECPLEESIWYYKPDEDERYIETYYMDLEDENLNRIFRGFRLMSIEKNEDNSVEFNIRSTVAVVFWGDYRYGFYYTEKDAPVDVMFGSEVKETEFVTTTGDFTYWYRTEKITDNFWYYETKIEFRWHYKEKR